MRERVEEWMRSRYADVSEVVSIDGDGSDWAGGTEAGFYSVFAVQITYLTLDGVKKRETVDGQEMGALWAFLMADT